MWVIDHSNSSYIARNYDKLERYMLIHPIGMFGYFSLQYFYVNEIYSGKRNIKTTLFDKQEKLTRLMTRSATTQPPAQYTFLLPRKKTCLKVGVGTNTSDRLTATAASQ